MEREEGTESKRIRPKKERKEQERRINNTTENKETKEKKGIEGKIWRIKVKETRK